MLQKLAQKLKQATVDATAFDTSRFNDPVAAQTDWSPLKGGGTNFRTHGIKQVSPHRLEFRATLFARIFYNLFILIGLGILAFAGTDFMETGEFTFDMEHLMPILFGLIFATIGTCLQFFGTTPINFDTQAGFFWKGKANPGNHFDRAAIKDVVPLKEIRAIQLISEHCRSSKSSFLSYELNLVTQSGDRINVVDHGNLIKLREDATVLAQFLGKPVWDAI